MFTIQFLRNCLPYPKARGIELFTKDDVHGTKSQVPSGWADIPIPECNPPPLPKVMEDNQKVADEVFEAPSTLSQEHYTALVRSVLMPWGTRAPSETNDLRTIAASNLREAFQVSEEVHSKALVAAHNANREVVHELNVHLNDGEALRHDSNSDDDNDLPHSVRIHAEKRVVEPFISLPQFDTTLHIALLRTEGADRNNETAKGISKAKNRPSNSRGGIFACCFGVGDAEKQKSSADAVAVKSNTMEGQLYISATLVLPRAEYKESTCLLYTSPSPRDRQKTRMPSSA